VGRHWGTPLPSGLDAGQSYRQETNPEIQAISAKIVLQKRLKSRILATQFEHLK
jgi:hypothetical protein